MKDLVMKASTSCSTDRSESSVITELMSFVAYIYTDKMSSESIKHASQ